MTNSHSEARPHAFTWSRLPLLGVLGLLAFYPVFAHFYVPTLTIRVETHLDQLASEVDIGLSRLERSYRPVTVTLTSGTTVIGQVTGDQLLCGNEPRLVGNRAMTLTLPDGNRWTGRDVLKVQAGPVVFPPRITPEQQADAIRIGRMNLHCTEQIQLSHL